MTLTALDLGLPSTCGIPESRGRITKEAVRRTLHPRGKAGRQLAEDVDSITMIATVGAESVAIPAGAITKQINVIGVGLRGTKAPEEFLTCLSRDLDTRSSHAGRILYVLYGDRGYAVAVYRNADVHVGLMTGTILLGDALADRVPRLRLLGDNLDETWDSLCAQVVLGDEDGYGVDARIAAFRRRKALERDLERLQTLHARTRQIATRNRLWDQMADIRRQLDDLQGGHR